MNNRILFSLAVAAGLAIMSAEASAQNVPLLLYDGETGTEFAGCLNCNRFESASVCNRFGDYGSKFSDNSIWNQFGQFGSKFQTNSPWNQFGEGLRIVDPDGNYYGRFTKSPFERSRLPLVRNLIAAYDQLGSLSDVRDLLCE